MDGCGQVHFEGRMGDGNEETHITMVLFDYKYDKHQFNFQLASYGSNLGNRCIWIVLNLGPSSQNCDLEELWRNRLMTTSVVWGTNDIIWPEKLLQMTSFGCYLLQMFLSTGGVFWRSWLTKTTACVVWGTDEINWTEKILQITSCGGVFFPQTSHTASHTRTIRSMVKIAEFAL